MLDKYGFDAEDLMLAIVEFIKDREDVLAYDLPIEGKLATFSIELNPDIENKDFDTKYLVSLRIGHKNPFLNFEWHYSFATLSNCSEVISNLIEIHLS